MKTILLKGFMAVSMEPRMIVEEGNSDFNSLPESVRASRTRSALALTGAGTVCLGLAAGTALAVHRHDPVSAMVGATGAVFSLKLVWDSAKATFSRKPSQPAPEPPGP